MKIINREKIKAGLLSFYPLIPLLILLDQVSKYFAKRDNVNLSIIKTKYFGFSFRFTENQGAAWSILSGQLVLLAIISLVAAVAMITYRIYARKKLTTLAKATWALLIGGTIGNLIDRAFFKNGVIDFISFRFGETYYFPTFNIADMCLVIGVIALLLLMAFGRDIKKPENLITVTKTPTEDSSSKEDVSSKE
ncbi:MAG: signal peptidase II [Bacilli bacterium]|jgi:signal peptidase II